MTGRTEPARQSPMERHLQTGIQVILVALCVWMATNVHEGAVNSAASRVTLQALDDKLTSLKSDIKDAISDVKRDVDDLRLRIRRLETAERSELRLGPANHGADSLLPRQ